MPMVDKPLNELKVYKGTNPRPADFDEYWDKAIAEMKAVDPDIELREAAFQTPSALCYDMYFTGVGGARIYSKFLRPRKIKEKCPAVVIFHGYSGHGGNWQDKLAYVCEGFCVFVMDVRGQGGKSEDTGGVKGSTLRGHIIRSLDDEDPHKLLFRNIFLDTAQLAGIAMDMDIVDETRVGAFGGSQGGGLTIACAALEPRIKRAAPIFPFLSDYKRVWEMDLAKDAYYELNYYFRNFDPRHEREDEIFTKLGYIDIQFLAPRIKAEVLMGTGLMDTICPPSTQFAAYNKMKCKKEMKIYPDFGHEGLPGFDDLIYQFMLGM
jgi:cephalosporin-C deacetylase